MIFEILDHQRGIPSKRKSAACVDYVPALCTHRPSLLPIEWFSEIFGLAPLWLSNGLGGCRKVDQTLSFRGSKSRNKVSVGEPAEGSLPVGVFLPSPVNCSVPVPLLVGAGEGVSQVVVDVKAGATRLPAPPIINFFFKPFQFVSVC